MLFSSTDKRYSVKLSEESINEMRSLIQYKLNETGGIVLGQYSDNLSIANVRNVTGPPSDSKSGRTWFVRGINGLKKLLYRLWEDKIYYLGEWHFHPKSKPKPSFQDISQMKKIATDQQYQCPEPILIIIGGTSEDFELKVFVTTPNNGFFEIPLFETE